MTCRSMNPDATRVEATIVTKWIRLIAVVTAFAIVPLTQAFSEEIKIAYIDAPLPFESPQAAMAIVFKNVLERETNGEITVSIFPASQLGTERETFESLRLGIVHGQISGEGTTVSFFPPMLALGIPYLYADIETAFEVMDGPYGERMKEAMRADLGIRILAASAPGPFRNFGANKELRSIDDLKGLRIRTTENPAHERMVRALGASPTPIPFGEMFSAIESGIVDGVELPSQAMLTMGITKLIPYVIEDQHIFQQLFLFMNDKWIESLSPEHKAAVEHAAEVAEIASRGQVFVWQAAGKEQLKAAGVSIYTPTQDELAVWRDRAQAPVIEWLNEQIDPVWVADLLAATKAASE